MTAATATRIPAPAGAVQVAEWQVTEWFVAGEEIVARTFTGTVRGGRVRVEIVGIQNCSARVLTRAAHVDAGHYGVELSAHELRELAANALAAAEELGQLGLSVGNLSTAASRRA